MIAEIENIAVNSYINQANKNVICDLFNSKGDHVATHYTYLKANGEISNLDMKHLETGTYLVKVSGSSFTKFMTMRKNP